MATNRIMVDLNGTLDCYRGWTGKDLWHPPQVDKRGRTAQWFLQELNKRFNEVGILTARSGPEEAIWGWLSKYNMDHLVDIITNEKMPSYLIVDDRVACHRGDYTETLALIDSFHAWWEDPDNPEWPGKPRT